VHDAAADAQARSEQAKRDAEEGAKQRAKIQEGRERTRRKQREETERRKQEVLEAERGRSTAEVEEALKLRRADYIRSGGNPADFDRNASRHREELIQERAHKTRTERDESAARFVRQMWGGK